jgi:hypothetical protein
MVLSLKYCIGKEVIAENLIENWPGPASQESIIHRSLYGFSFNVDEENWLELCFEEITQINVFMCWNVMWRVLFFALLQQKNRIFCRGHQDGQHLRTVKWFQWIFHGT